MTIPQSKELIAEYLEIFSGYDKDSDGRVDTFEQFVDNEYRRLNITLRTGNYKDELFSATKGLEGIKRIEDYMSRHPKGKMYKWIIVGEPFNFAILMKLILQGQILSVILTLCIIGLMLTFLLKNWKAGLVSLVPLVISIAVVYGSMAFLGITLDLAKCLLAAIAIGIGIDDTIHMMKTLKYFLTRG